MTARILLVEDDPDIRLVIADLLRAEGYEVEVEEDGTAGLATASSGHWDALILDVMLPGMDGFQLCSEIRRRGFAGGILMLTARTQVEDRVAGLNTGADDYVMKPFDPRELSARVEALLRRVHKPSNNERCAFGDIDINFTTREVKRRGERIAMTGKELELLRCLVEHRGKVVSRDEMLKQVWTQQPFITPRTVDTHVAWLRQKIEPDPQIPRFILTVRGEGYRFEP